MERIVEQQGRDVLILTKLERPHKTWSKSPMFYYQLEYRWLSNEGEFEGINSHVLGNEFSLCTKADVAEVITGRKTLFENFNLY